MTEVLLYLVAANLALVLGLMVLRHRSRTLHTQALGAILAFTLLLLATGQTSGFFSLLPVWLACLFLLGPALLVWGFRLASRARHYRLAAVLTRALDLNLLRKGDGTAETLRGIALARAGKGDGHLEDLEKRLAASEPHSPEACALQRRILLLLAAMGRHEEVVACFEGPSPQHPRAWEPLGAALIRSLAELGRWREVVEAMLLLERGPASQDLHLRSWVDQARLVFLAGAGQAALLEELLPPKGGFAEEVPQDQVKLWRERAHALQELPPHELPPGLLPLVIQRARQSAALPRTLSWGPSIAPVTTLLVLVNLAVFLLSELLGGSTSPLVLHRLGALFSWPFFLEEPWRLVGYLFLHYGPTHLIVNLLALWIFGRLAEQAFGPWRFWAVYLSGGLIGALVSLLFGAPGFRVGASGAVLGVVGGATMLFRRGGVIWPPAWRRMMFGGLLVTLIGSVGIGLFFPLLDNLAHLGGALGGMAVAWLLGGRLPRKGSGLARNERTPALITGLLTVALAAYVLPAAARFDPALGSWREVEGAGLTLEIPPWWHPEEEPGSLRLESPDQGRNFGRLRHLDEIRGDDLFSEGEPWPAPAPWHGLRLDLTREGQPVSRLIFYLAVPKGTILATFTLHGPAPHPDVLLLDRVLTSIRAHGD